jgi:hypothetical protein
MHGLDTVRPGIINGNDSRLRYRQISQGIVVSSYFFWAAAVLRAAHWHSSHVPPAFTPSDVDYKLTSYSLEMLMIVSV